MKRIFTLTVIALAGLVFCGKKAGDDPQTNKVPVVASPGEFGITRITWTTSVTAQDRAKLALSLRDTPIELKGGEQATIQTNEGTFTAEFYSKDAPKTVSNFIRLAESGFYDGLKWHRYVPDFVIQGGDPLGNGMGNAGYMLDFEANSRKHELGALAMARGTDKNSASCQFYICLAPQPGLDGEYVVFGKVLEGMDVVKKLRAQDTIVRISVTKGK